MRAERNLLRAAACWAAASEGGRVWERDALFCTSSPVPIRSFNQTFLTGRLKTAGALGEVAAWYAEAGLRFRVRTRAGLEDTMRGAATAAGLVRQGGMPCMTFEGQIREGPAGDLQVKPVVDARTLADHVHVVAEAFGWQRDDLGRVFGPALLDEGAWTAWVGYADSRPVATAQLVVHGGVAGLYYIGTVESHRGKGYGEAMTVRAMREGLARGCDLVSLQASPAGSPLYERLGFRVIGEYVTYVPAATPPPP